MADKQINNSINNKQVFNALVLAASRKGINDEVAKLQNRTHKCVVELNGIVMIERVVKTLIESNEFNKIYVSIDNPEILNQVNNIKLWIEEQKVQVIISKNNLSNSILSAVEDIPNPYPLVITAGDNALHTPKMISFFCSEIRKSNCDAYIAMTRAKLIIDKYPEGARAFHKLKDDEYSSCNLYAVKNDKGVNGAKPFATGGQFGKKPMRIARAFGITSLLMYKLQMLSLHDVASRISKAIKAKVSCVIMPWAEGPIDVDNVKDFKLVNKILKEKEG